MTTIPVENNSPLVTIVAVDGQTVFDFGYLIQTAAQLQVVRTPVGGGTPVTLTLDTDYTIPTTSLNDNDGGQITLTVASFPTGAAAGDLYTLSREIPITRTTDFSFRGSYNADTINAQLDTLFLILQEQERDIARALTLNIADAASSVELPIDTERKNKFLAFDNTAEAQPIAAAGTSASLGPVSAYIDTLLPAADAAAARLTLDAASITVENSFTARQRWAKGADLASAATVVVGSDGNRFDITGTTQIDGFTVPAGTLFMVQFDGVLTLNDGASHILPGGADIVTAAGDRAIYYAIAADTVEMLNYQPIGLALYEATAAEMIAGVASNRLVTPRRMADFIEIRPPIPTTSGTAFDFTSIRANAKRLTVMLEDVSLTGLDQLLVQIGTSVGIEAAGYASTSADSTTANSQTIGFVIQAGQTAANLCSGHLILTLKDAASNTWVESHSVKVSTLNMGTGGGNKSLADTLTQLRVTRTGASTFDAGSVGLMIE